MLIHHKSLYFQCVNVNARNTVQYTMHIVWQCTEQHLSVSLTERQAFSFSMATAPFSFSHTDWLFRVYTLYHNQRMYPSIKPYNNIVYFFNERIICYLIHNFSGGKQCPCKSLIAWYTSQIILPLKTTSIQLIYKKKKIVANRILLAVHQKGKENMNNSERYLSPVHSLWECRTKYWLQVSK